MLDKYYTFPRICFDIMKAVYQSQRLAINCLHELTTAAQRNEKEAVKK